MLAANFVSVSGSACSPFSDSSMNRLITCFCDSISLAFFCDNTLSDHDLRIGQVIEMYRAIAIYLHFHLPKCDFMLISTLSFTRYFSNLFVKSLMDYTHMYTVQYYIPITISKVFGTRRSTDLKSHNIIIDDTF